MSKAGAALTQPEGDRMRLKLTNPQSTTESPDFSRGECQIALPLILQNSISKETFIPSDIYVKFPYETREVNNWGY